ncbi:PKD domain-containing protein, partial [Fulvivirga aurantia]|uniref:PKD domain-containing protein n=1 Tax=Fulvivirga aurantia TaxID=2529383 RepID=UPI002483679E
MMNIFKKGIGALLMIVIIVSCKEDDSPNPTGLSEITLSSFSATPGPDENGIEDGTYITVTPISIGVSSYTVDFGDPTSEDDVLIIDEQGGSIAYDYPNDNEEATYTITVTAQSDAGLAPVSKSEDVVVMHTVVQTINTAPASPELRDANVFALFSNGFEYNGQIYSWEHGEAATGGITQSVNGNDVIQFSRLGSSAGTLEMSTVEVANAIVGIEAVTDIHFDVYSVFAEGIDLLKVTLVNEGASTTYQVDGLALTDSEWTSFDLNLTTGFSGAVDAIDEIRFELGTGGAASDHATIFVDNVYLYKSTGSEIINGDFEADNNIWRFPLFSDESTTNPYGSSSDGSNFDIDGNNTGDKTAGAKWSSSQSGGIGDFRTSDSRYAYQELSLTPNTDYVLEYQYAIREGDGASLDGNKVVGVVMDGFYIDGVEAVNDIVSNNLGFHEGFIAEGKFNETTNGYGTFVQIPFTSNASGGVSVMFYANTAVDAYIDNVKVLEQTSVAAPTAAFTAEATAGNFLEYNFTNESINASSFAWDFGDGNTSSEKSPTHVYASGGDYVVTLTATNVAGDALANENLTVSSTGVPATFKVVVLNGTGDDLTIKASDNADAFDMTPPSTIYDAPDTQPSPYTWDNGDLDTWLATNCGDDSEQPGSTSDGNVFAQLGDRGYKLSEACRRLYQPVTVEVGVEYTFTIDSRSEAAGVTSEVFILNTAILDEAG